MWLGVKDPVFSIAGARAADPKRAALRDLHVVLLKDVGVEKDFSAAYLCELAQKMDPNMPGNVPAHPELLSVLGEGKRLSAKSIGNLLMKELGRVSTYGGRRYAIRLASQDRHGNRYVIKEIRAEGAETEEQQRSRVSAQVGEILLPHLDVVGAELWSQLAAKITDGLVDAENNPFGKSKTDAVFSVLWELDKQIPAGKSTAIEASFTTVFGKPEKPKERPF
jgi:hypothetical protein